MAKLSKRINAFRDKVELGKYYSIQDAVNLLKEISSVKFDESVEVAINLGAVSYTHLTLPTRDLV